jgi:hypothetical protein
MRSTMSVLLSRSAVASVIAFAAASSYIYLAQSHAQEAANDFCATVQSGEPEASVAARAQSVPEKSFFTQGHHGLVVMFGHSQRYVCDVRFSHNLVSAKAVTLID